MWSKSWFYFWRFTRELFIDIKLQTTITLCRHKGMLEAHAESDIHATGKISLKHLRSRRLTTTWRPHRRSCVCGSRWVQELFGTHASRRGSRVALESVVCDNASLRRPPYCKYEIANIQSTHTHWLYTYHAGILFNQEYCPKSKKFTANSFNKMVRYCGQRVHI